MHMVDDGRMSTQFEQIHSQVVKGEVFAQDRATQCLLIREPIEGSSKCNLRVLKANCIKVRL